jgi:hypothetical protein
MTPRNRPWVVASALLLPLCLVLAVRLWRGPPPPRPATVLQALARLEEGGCRLRVVFVAADTPEGGVWLCKGARPRGELLRLRRAWAAPWREQWRGTALLAADGAAPPGTATTAEAQAAGAFVRLGPLTLWGDPEVVREAVDALAGH